MKAIAKGVSAGLALLLVSGCAQTPDSDSAADVDVDTTSASAAQFDFDFRDERDPWERMNRPLYDFNRSVLDPYLISPAASAYALVPQPVRDGLFNATENIVEPASTVNNLLQGKFKAAGISAGRFLMNSTIGLFGLFDVASKMGVGKEQESFGETLAVYGVPDGPYVMLPGAGPTVIIDRGGDFVDGYVWPATLLSWPVSIARYAIRGLETRIALRDLEPMLNNAIDEYAFVREAYFSTWRDKVYDGNPPMDDLYDDFDDWGDDWGDDWDDGWGNEGNNSSAHSPVLTPASYKFDLNKPSMTLPDNYIVVRVRVAP